MEIITYFDAQHQTKLQAAYSHEWLIGDLKMEHHLSDEVKPFMDGYKGINVNKFIKQDSRLEKSIYFIDHPFSNTEKTYIYSKQLAISVPDFFPGNVIVGMSLYVAKWLLSDVVICSNDDCTFGSRYDNIKIDVCSCCQEKLIENNLTDYALKLLLLCDAYKRYSDSELNDILSRSILDYMKVNFPEKSHPSIIALATDYVINNIAQNGTDKRSWLNLESKKISEYKVEIKQNYKRLANNIISQPYFIAARRWNSWTPILPTGRANINQISNNEITNKTGGGYFMSDGISNIVVDPGYGFMQTMFRYHNITVMDIDAIIITHDHPDHSSDLMNILSLRFVYKEQCRSPLRILLNPSTYYLYNNYSKYYSDLLYEGKVHLLSIEGEYFFDNWEIRTKGMFHDEIYHNINHNDIAEVGDSEALGLKIIGKSQTNDIFNISIVGDTSLPLNSSDLNRISDFFTTPDIAAIHIGSLEAWFDKEHIPACNIEYGERKHLGLNGCARIINILKPKLAVITEFGEELHNNDYRLACVDFLKETCLNRKTIILPSDITLTILINNKSLYCRCPCDHDNARWFIPIDKVSIKIDKDDQMSLIEYYHPAGCRSKMDHYKF